MDAQAFGADIVAAVRSFLELELDPLLARLDAVEQRFAAMSVPRDGKDADPEAVAVLAIAKIAPDLAALRSDLAAHKNIDLADAMGVVADAHIARALAELSAPKESVTIDDVAPMVKAEVERIASDWARLIPEAVEAAVKVLPPAINGKDADPEVIRQMVTEAVASLPPAKDGKDVDPEIVKSVIAEMVERAVSALPAPAPGKDADPEVIRQLVTEAVASLPPAKDGKDVDPEIVKAAIAKLVETALAGWPRPQDGKGVTVEELRPLVDESVAKAVSAIPVPKDGKDGADVVDLLIDRDGALVATLSNGRTKKLGPVVGKDADDAAIEKSIADKVASLPVPKDGKDGLGFEDMTEELADDGRTIIRRYVSGDQVKEFRHAIAVVLDRGVFKEGSEYVAGDGVTWAGSFWIAQEPTREKPDTGKGWRLAVKRGRDGKDGKVLPPAPTKVKL